ncbi:HD domain-containing protein [Virgibacillus ihumii]|uniref:HD domain-containing protein n=1 Tax=Virgibacillus ihumii TaxID=2686091 RepID=UPI00157D521B|nr:HD domain-containing protein [Virgibacillus ihumii]
MNNDDKIAAIRDYVFAIFSSDATGHDFHHMSRVADAARTISEAENANPFICEAAAWIHDIGDEKLFADRTEAINDLTAFLLSSGITRDETRKILQAAEDVSFRKGNVPDTLEGKIVQDADRLDAIGAVGIARTFAYGGSNGQLIWSSTESDGTSIQHFYDKLLLLKGRMNTNSAIRIAEKRHRFMEMYLDQFFSEWCR